MTRPSVLGRNPKPGMEWSEKRPRRSAGGQGDGAREVAQVCALLDHHEGKCEDARREYEDARRDREGVVTWARSMPGFLDALVSDRGEGNKPTRFERMLKRSAGKEPGARSAEEDALYLECKALNDKVFKSREEYAALRADFDNLKAAYDLLMGEKTRLENARGVDGPVDEAGEVDGPMDEAGEAYLPTPPRP